jgi:hypothetical protein
MHVGRLVFSQVIDHLPMHTFRRCVARYDGNRYKKTFSCFDHYFCMAFAQLTFRESLRDIEACLRAHKDKLYHMGIRGNVSRSTLADANERRDWRIHADLAQTLIGIARPLYAYENFGLDLDNTVYALDASTIDLCLSVFPWALFRSTKSAVKLHTLLDLRGNIPTFIHISDGKLHDVNVLDILLPEPGAFYIMDRGYVDFQRLFLLYVAGSFFVIRAKSNTKYRRRYSYPVDKSGGVRCDQSIVLTGVKSARDYPAILNLTPCPSRAAPGVWLRGLERLQHEVEEVVPGGERQVLRECAQVFEEGAPTPSSPFMGGGRGEERSGARQPFIASGVALASPLIDSCSKVEHHGL